MSTDFETLSFLFQEHVMLAFAWSAFISGLTVLALGTIKADVKDGVALWLMAAPSNKSWETSFLKLFDGFFGQKILSIKFFIRSLATSLLAITMLWVSFGTAGAFGIRIEGQMTLGSSLAIGVCINVLADYLSLAETRGILGMMSRFEKVVPRLFLLLVDLVCSAAIIWFAIFLYVLSPLSSASGGLMPKGAESYGKV